jgi:hypothetical protein
LQNNQSSDLLISHYFFRPEIAGGQSQLFSAGRGDAESAVITAYRHVGSVFVLFTGSLVFSVLYPDRSETISKMSSDEQDALDALEREASDFSKVRIIARMASLNGGN